MHGLSIWRLSSLEVNDRLWRASLDSVSSDGAEHVLDIAAAWRDWRGAIREPETRLLSATRHHCGQRRTTGSDCDHELRRLSVELSALADYSKGLTMHNYRGDTDRRYRESNGSS